MPNIKCYISGLGFTLRAYATPQRCSSYAWRHKQWFCPGRWGQWWSAQSQQLQRLINYSCCNFTRLHLCKQKTNQTLLTTTTPFKTKQKRFPKEAKTNKQTTTRTTFPFAWRWFKQKSQQEQEAGCPQLRAQPKNKPKKMDVVQPCNAKKNGICWYWALQCPQKIFAIFLPKWQKLSYIFGLILLLLLMPPHFTQASTPSFHWKTSQNSPLKKSKKKFLIKNFTSLNLNQCPEAFVKRK